jgi:hypothetical protein
VVKGRFYEKTCLQERSASSGIRAEKRFFSFCRRKKEESPCRKEEEIDNHLIQRRKGRRQEEGVDRYIIQK